jgi:hypothetical protein
MLCLNSGAPDPVRCTPTYQEDTNHSLWQPWPLEDDLAAEATHEYFSSPDPAVIAQIEDTENSGSDIPTIRPHQRFNTQPFQGDVNPFQNYPPAPEASHTTQGYSPSFTAHPVLGVTLVELVN